MKDVIQNVTFSMSFVENMHNKQLVR